MIDQGGLDFLGSFQDLLVIEVDGLGATLFCHGSSRSNEEILTRVTPERRLGGQQPIGYSRCCRSAQAAKSSTGPGGLTSRAATAKLES